MKAECFTGEEKAAAARGAGLIAVMASMATDLGTEPLTEGTMLQRLVYIHAVMNGQLDELGRQRAIVADFTAANLDPMRDKRRLDKLQRMATGWGTGWMLRTMDPGKDTARVALHETNRRGGQVNVRDAIDCVEGPPECRANGCHEAVEDGLKSGRPAEFCASCAPF